VSFTAPFKSSNIPLDYLLMNVSLIQACFWYICSYSLFEFHLRQEETHCIE
jgi:hypothetical protein